MAKKTRIASRAKRAERPEEAATQVVYDDRSMLIRVLDHIAEKGIYAIILFVPLAFLPDTHWLFDLTRVSMLRILTLIVLAAYLCRLAIAREWRIVRPPSVVLWPILLYLAFYAIATIYSISPNLSLYSGEGRNFGLISLGNMVLLFFLVINIMTDRKQLMRCLTLLIASGTAVALLGLYQFYGHFDTVQSGRGIQEKHLQIVLGIAALAAAVFFCLAVFLTRLGNEKRVWFAVLFAAALALTLCLAFDLSTDTNAFDAPQLSDEGDLPQENGILYSKTGEDSDVYTTWDYTWLLCDDESGNSTARLEGVHQIAPMMGHRTSSTFGNPDFLIPFLVLLIPISVAFVLRRKWIYVAPLLVLGLCLSMSLPYKELGGYWAVFLIGFGVLIAMIIGMFIPKRYLLYYALIILIVAVSGFGANVAGSRDKANDFLEDHVGLDPDDDRALLWGIALDTMDSTRSKIVGSGPNTFRDTFTQHVTLEYSQGKPDRREDKVHNSFIEALATTGWLGFISYILMFFSIAMYFIIWLFRNFGKKQWSFVALILVAVVFYIIQALAIFHTVIPYTYFWLIVAIGVALTIVDNPQVRTIHLNTSKMFASGLAFVFLTVSILGVYLAARPLVADYFFQEGLRARNCQDYSGAAEMFKKAHNWNGFEARYNLEYASALLGEAAYLGDPEVNGRNCAKAAELTTDALESEPESAMMYYNRAIMLSDCGYDPEIVLPDVHEAINLYKNGYLGRWLLASVETDRGNIEGAIIADKNAFIIVPEYLSGKMRTSLTEYQTAQLRLGNNYTILGKAYEENGDLDAAQEQYDNAADILSKVAANPITKDEVMSAYMGAQVSLGQNYTSLGANYKVQGVLDESQAQYEKAVEVLQIALEMSPEDAGARFFLARAYEMAGNIEAAEREYEDIVRVLEELKETNADDDVLRYLLGAAYEGLGDFDKAQEEYETALEINPDLQEAKTGLERLEEKRKEAEAS